MCVLTDQTDSLFCYTKVLLHIVLLHKGVLMTLLFCYTKVCSVTQSYCSVIVLLRKGVLMTLSV